MAYDETNGILYSGGRDGLTVGWKVDTQVDSKVNKHSEPYFSSQHHSDWINDVTVAHNGQSVFTASSDLTVKLWQPYKEQQENKVSTVGFHKDFVKCLSYVQSSEWLFSAGLDGKINIWDVNQATSTIENKGMDINSLLSLCDPEAPNTSYYSLAVSQTGRLVSAGSPDGWIRLWDPRSSPNSGTIAHFTGHSDLVRSLLMSDDGRWILSGSSDCTIKLWSMASQRCIKTYTMHTEPVWTLFSAEPDFKYFYAGSRNGMVTKTLIPQDITDDNKGINSEGNHYYLEELDNDDDSNTVTICQEEKGITSIIAHKDHSCVWTSTTNAEISKWEDVEPTELVKEKEPIISDSGVGDQLGLININPVSISQFDGNYGNETNLVDFEKHTFPNTLANGATIENITNAQNDNNDSSEDEEFESNLVPIRLKPLEIIKGKTGLTKCFILSNRFQVLSLDSKGEVMLWDIVKCCFVRSYGQANIDEVYQEINSLISVPSWCTVDTKLGSLMVRLDENKCFDAEIYGDDIEDMKIESTNKESNIISDTQINIGKWVIKSLFKAFTKKYLEEKAQLDLLEEKAKKGEELNKANNTVTDDENKEETSNKILVSLNSPTCPQPVHTSIVKDDTPLSPFSVTLSSITNHHHLPPKPTASMAGPRKMSTGSILTSKTGMDGQGYFNYNPDKIPSPPAMIARSYTTNNLSDKSQSPTNNNSQYSYQNENTLSQPVSTPTSPGGNQSINPPPPALSSSSSFMGRLRQFSQKKLNRSPDPPKALNLSSTDNFSQGSTRPINDMLNPTLSPHNSKFTPISPTTPEKPNNSSSSSPSTETNQNNAPIPEESQPKTSSENPIPPPPKDTVPQTNVNSTKSPSLNEPNLTKIPPLDLPPHINLLLSEESHDVSRCIDVFSGSLGNQIQDYPLLTKNIPSWIKNCLINDSIPFKEPVKIAFLLKPQESSGLSSLPSSSSRLLASRTLRCKKLVGYIWDKLNFTPDILHNLLLNRQNQVKSEVNSNSTPTTTTTTDKIKAPLPSTLPPFIPENWIVLSCNGQPVSLTMTLATVRYHLWKSGGDMVLTYDIQPLPSTEPAVLATKVGTPITNLEGGF
ncbi:WD40 repeat-like protein [Neoconidiobolus thromboides FSU 785]|nr:WD40 repeat-like protein [Neoconidiobolus thromboides FSU 785]